jgi:DNA-binding MarR family transcriptional regulator
MPGTSDHGLVPELTPEAAEVLQAATRLLVGVALRSLDALGAAVTLPQFRLLAALADLGPAPSGQAARTLGVDRSTVTRLADRLVAAGHVSRGSDPRHRGVVILELTDSGRDLVAKVDAWRQQELAQIMGRLAPTGRAAVTGALGQLVHAAGDDYATAARSPVPLLTGARRWRRRAELALAGCAVALVVILRPKQLGQDRGLADADIASGGQQRYRPPGR